MQHPTDKTPSNAQPQSQPQSPTAFQFPVVPSSSLSPADGSSSGTKPPCRITRLYDFVTQPSTSPHPHLTMNHSPPSSSPAPLPPSANGNPTSFASATVTNDRPVPCVPIGSLISKAPTLSHVPSSESSPQPQPQYQSQSICSTIPLPMSSDPQHQGFGHSVTLDEMTRSLQGSTDPLWQLIRHEAKHVAQVEPHLASSLYGDILVHDSLEDTISAVLSSVLHIDTFQAIHWVGLFQTALTTDTLFSRQVRADITAFMQRDPMTTHPLRVLLHAKGFQALQSWRLANWLWKKGRINLALFLQSRISSTFAVDIHPAATIGSGVLIDHDTGIVIGETAKIGNNVSLLQNVTLGGTGKESGDRHPKIHDGVKIGAGATILGNIHVGTCAHVAACSVVLKPVEPYAVVSGVPAKVVGKVSYNAGLMPSFSMDQRLSLQLVGASNPYQQIVTGNVKASATGKDDECVYIGGGV